MTTLKLKSTIHNAQTVQHIVQVPVCMLTHSLYYCPSVYDQSSFGSRAVSAEEKQQRKLRIDMSPRCCQGRNYICQLLLLVGPFASLAIQCLLIWAPDAVQQNKYICQLLQLVGPLASLAIQCLLIWAPYAVQQNKYICQLLQLVGPLASLAIQCLLIWAPDAVKAETTSTNSSC